MATIQGTAMGGENPILGANMILWQTSSGGYGSSNAVQLATTTSGAGGAFSFTTGYTCASGQFVYLTGTGGNVSGNSGNVITNNNVVLMAALGSCSNFANSTAQGKVAILINELSTVAAAYTLGNFLTVNENTATPGSELVYVGAPAKNNATSGSCTGTGSTMTCTAAGLAHAFADAANLVDAVHYDGTFPSGAALTTVPGNSRGSIPQAEINALGDIMQYCTNSSGGVAGDGSACGNLFANATPSSGTAPADTLSAMIDIAQNPTSNVGTSTTGLFAMIPSTPAFQPVLSGPPHDWALAVTYTGLVVSGSSSSWGSSATYYPEWLALDANDDVYVLAGNATTSATAVTSTISALTSNGTGLWANASTVDGASGCYPGMLATDTNGYVWNTYSAPSGKTCTAAIYGRSIASGGAAPAANIFTSAAPYSIQVQAAGLAFDRYNNMWYVRSSSSGANMMFQFPYAGAAGTYQNTSTVAAAVTLNGTTGSPAGTIGNGFDIVTDANSNVYVSTYSTSVVGSVYVVPNLTPASTPSYAGGGTYLNQGLQSSASHSGAIGLDQSGNIWAGGASGQWSKIAPTVSSGVITGLSASNLTVQSGTTTASTPYPGQIDGAGTFWFPSFTSSGQVWYTRTGSSTTTPTTSYIYPCYAPSGATTCSANGTNTNSPRMLQIDSTGAIWVPGEGAGDVVQILGSAAPLWPQLSYGIFATAPQ